MKVRKYATLKDVASHAGVTPATVSYVLNGAKNRYISVKMREKVERAAKELNYVKSNAASTLKGKHTNIIAVLIPQFQNQFFTEMVLEIEKVSDKHGYILSICNTFDNHIREKEIIEKMERQRVDGYIIVPSERGAENISSLVKFGVPLVIADRDISVLDCSSILTQNYKGIEISVQKLLDNNHTNIAYIGWDVQYGGLEERLQSFEATMNKAGLSDYPVILGALSYECGVELTKSALNAHPDITGIVFGNNIQAAGGIDYLVSSKKIDAISVVILGHPRWAQTGHNDYCCVDLNGTTIGKKSAELLFKQIKGTENEIVREIVDCTFYDGSSVRKLGI